MKTRTELLDLIPAYALGALDDDDRAAVEAWLEDDPEARALLEEYRAVSDHLVALAPLRAAPGHLQADLRRRLAEHPEPTVQAVPVTAPGRARPNRRFAWALAAAALLVVAVLGTLLLARPQPVDAAALYARLVAQPDTSRYELVAGDVSAAVYGNLVTSADGTQAVLCMWSLPSIAANQTFQMWLIDASGARTSGGLFRADAARATYVAVPFDRPISLYQGVGVSLEPAGGSPYADQPSGPRVLSVPLG